MSKVLVTGANGQLGNEMRLVSKNAPADYFFTDVEELDITNMEAIRHFVSENSINIIVNCAAYTAVDKAEDEVDTADLINHKAVANLVRVCKEMDATLIHISTDYVFQGDKNLPYNEENPTNPLGVYGKTKLEGEQAVLSSGCRYLIFRTAWLYSTFGNNFVKTMLKLTAEKESLQVVFDQVGTPTYARDLAVLIHKIIEEGSYKLNNGIYHFSNEGVCSWYDFAQNIAELAGNHKCSIQPCYSSQFPSKVKRPAFSVLDKSKVKNTFHVEIPFWRNSLKDCINKLLS